MLAHPNRSLPSLFLPLPLPFPSRRRSWMPAPRQQPSDPTRWMRRPNLRSLQSLCSRAQKASSTTLSLTAATSIRYPGPQGAFLTAEVLASLWRPPFQTPLSALLVLTPRCSFVMGRQALRRCLKGVSLPKGLKSHPVLSMALTGTRVALSGVSADDKAWLSRTVPLLVGHVGSPRPPRALPVPAGLTPFYFCSCRAASMKAP